MAWLQLAVVAVAVASCHAAAQYPSSVGTVYLDEQTQQLVFKAVEDPKGVAFGNFTDQTLHPSAFGQLVISTNNAFNDTLQAK